MPYAHPEALVSTDWVAAHVNDPAVRLIEVDVDTTAYDAGHVAGAVGWNWQSQLNDPVRRDIPDKAAFAKLLSDAGVTPKTTVVSSATTTTGSRRSRSGCCNCTGTRTRS